MIITENSIETSATPQQVWKIYASVSAWPQWDTGIESASLTDNTIFKAGATGTIKPKKGPAVTFIIDSMRPYQSFSATARLPLTKLIFSHILTLKNGKTVITHHVELRGLLAPLFAFIMGKNIRKEMPSVMQKLAHLAEHSQTI